MRLFRSWRYARGTSLLAMVILLCVGTFLCLLPTELEVSAALTTAHSTPLDQRANEGYFAALAEEAEASDKLPRNATLLTALLLTVFFGIALGWLLVSGRTRRRLEGFALMGYCFPSIGCRHQRRLVAALLGVFRL
jgi:hypothetical protein